eukprot:861974-Alexandrium_andersonii.AAC.1
MQNYKEVAILGVQTASSGIPSVRARESARACVHVHACMRAHVRERARLRPRAWERAGALPSIVRLTRPGDHS